MLTCACSSTLSIAPNGQSSMHTSHPPQTSVSTEATIGSISTSPLIIGIAALAAAPDACATASGISFGP